MPGTHQLVDSSSSTHLGGVQLTPVAKMWGHSSATGRHSFARLSPWLTWHAAE